MAVLQILTLSASRRDRVYRQRIAIVLGCLGVLMMPSLALAQIGSSCVRPLAIPDKWSEMTSAPWDLSATFDVGDIYRGPLDPLPTGFVPATDEGRPFELHLPGPGSALAATTAVPFALGGTGSTIFRDNIVQCPSVLVETGLNLEAQPGNLAGPLTQAMQDLINLDPDAFWDPTANDGQGGVTSGFATSPRVIALPVFDPQVFADGQANGEFNINVVRIVGFFVAAIEGSVVQGYLTGRSMLTAADVSVTSGETATLSAVLTGPGAPVSGVSVDFSLEGNAVGNTLTNTEGRAELGGVDVGGFGPGTFTNSVLAALGEAGFFTAVDATADLTIRVATTTTLIAAPNPSKSGDAVTFTATVASAPPGGGTPTGTVVFLRDGVSVGSATLAGGVATLNLPLSGGKFGFTAQYQQSATHTASTSNVVLQVVKGKK